MRTSTFYLIFLSVLFFACNSDDDSTSETNVGDGNNLVGTLGAAPDVKDVQFGYAKEFDGNSFKTAVDVNSEGKIVEVHQSRTTRSVWYHTGQLDPVANVVWSESKKLDNGLAPTVCFNDSGIVVEAHETSNIITYDLYYHVGIHNGTDISWSESHKYDRGVQPSIDMNNNNQIVEIHRSEGNSGLFARVGTVNPDSKTISWNDNTKFDTGNNPEIALNNNGTVIEVHNSETSGKLYYHVGQIKDGHIEWGQGYQYESGASPSVVLQDDGTVIEVHASEGLNDDIWSRIGKVEGDQIVWHGASSYFDDGKFPNVGGTADFAIQVHESEDPLGGIYSSACKILDRGNWMINEMPSIGSKTLGQIAIPGSHDAGMYELSLGQTQDLSIYGQLHHGSRFFDLRLDGDLHIYHGPIQGPSVDVVIDDIKKFMDEGREELIILKFSHFKDFNGDLYKSLVDKLHQNLGAYLYKNDTGKRLGEITISEYVSNGGKLLVVVDENYEIDFPSEDIYVYRDWSKDDLQNADLIVFDEYSNTTSYEDMKNDQLRALNEYNGKTPSGYKVDMFLLSWTLTPVTGVFIFSSEPNANLGLEALQFPKIPNILYLDFMESARPVDVSIYLNQKF
ncbi:phosphatidylinositol-specific phospholipase C domain-containing protein [Aureivirga sp. CE67]|uniref:phosphatidylinositol-specific phospholipase C domain-containing protein n=1 Tax=Aureivirga sp. CE67 TaxID=1788983 RepID=UPI0018CA45F4|nr:phosphatidylinositol-specific phospholipase C domain-containing protein [Aureivirga sp. CE67]